MRFDTIFAIAAVMAAAGVAPAAAGPISPWLPSTVSRPDRVASASDDEPMVPRSPGWRSGSMSNYDPEKAMFPSPRSKRLKMKGNPVMCKLVIYMFGNHHLVDYQVSPNGSIIQNINQVPYAVSVDSQCTADGSRLPPNYTAVGSVLQYA